MLLGTSENFNEDDGARYPGSLWAADICDLALGTSQDHGKGGLRLRGVVVTTGTATTAETAKTVSWHCVLWDKQMDGKVLFRTAKTVKTAKTVMKAIPPLNPTPAPEILGGHFGPEKKIY